LADYGVSLSKLLQKTLWEKPLKLLRSSQSYGT